MQKLGKQRPSYRVPTLDFDYQKGILPLFSPQQFVIHYLDHHEQYVVELNHLIEKSKLDDKDLGTIIRETQNDEKNIRIYQLACEHFSHSFFWSVLKARPKEERKGADLVMHKINNDFKGFEQFKKIFEGKCLELFGSGFVWLVRDEEGNRLRVWTCQSGCPLQEKGLYPLLCCDMWEHSYYFDYKANKSAYLSNFWKCVNWTKINELYEFSLRPSKEQ